MQVVITALGPDSTDLVNPIIRFVTAAGANIAEIQMYDHDDEHLFAMLVRVHWTGSKEALVGLRTELQAIGRIRGLSVRVWSAWEREGKARLAICTTYRPECPMAVLDAVQAGGLDAEVAVMIGNRRKCETLADQHGVPFEHIGDGHGAPDNERLVELIDSYDVDYIVLARYMRVLPASVCWRFAGGRIVNLHHGLLPSFKGFKPYHDAYAARMLTYGATAHFIVPELDAGEQIVHQDTFTVRNGTPLVEIIAHGQSVHEPRCLVEGLSRVIRREVELHFHRVVARASD